MSREYSAALSTSLHNEALAHLLRPDGQEDLCFAVWFPSEGSKRTTALLHHLILPQENDRSVHGNASFSPGYFERALGEAMAVGGGVAFLHSHVGPGWQDMSSDDIRAEQSHAASTMGATGLPLVGLTLGTDGAWSARFWVKTAPRMYMRQWCTAVRVVGEHFRMTFMEELRPRPRFKEAFKRTRSAWGDRVQSDIGRLHIGIIGAGSVGSIVAEALARSGVSRISLMDFDSVEELNLDRTLHAYLESARVEDSKVASLGRGLRKSATADGFEVDELEFSVGEEAGYRAALDCDIIFSCVDRPWPRAVLNMIAYAHLVPIIDGGIQVEVSKDGTLKRADWKAHIVSPDRRCMECLGQYNAGLVQGEREGWLDDPDYIKGLPEAHPLKRNENVIAFSLSTASFEVLQMLMMIVEPYGLSDPGRQQYHFVPGLLDEAKFDECDDSCLYPGLIAKGDRADYVVTGKHKIAEEARERRARNRRQAPQVPFWRRMIQRIRIQIRRPGDRAK